MKYLRYRGVNIFGTSVANKDFPHCSIQEEMFVSMCLCLVVVTPLI